MIQEAPKASRDVLEVRQQVKALECRLAALEDKGKPQPPAKTDQDAPTYGQEIHELRQQVKNLESQLAKIEAGSLGNGTAAGKQNKGRKTTPNLPSSQLLLPKPPTNENTKSTMTC
jgi:BMFP domain-containing protein YqiC